MGFDTGLGVEARNTCQFIPNTVSGKETPSGAADAGQGISDIRLL